MGAALMRLNGGTRRSMGWGGISLPSGMTTVAVARIVPGGTRIATLAFPAASVGTGPNRWRPTSSITLTPAMPALTCQLILPTSGIEKKPRAWSG